MQASVPATLESSPPVLQARGLHKAYGNKVALHSVDLSLQRGEFVALLGPNGAGKSTLIQILSGLFVPDQGDLWVLGHDIRRHAPRALAQLGVVFQQSSLDLDLSIRANLLFHTDLHGMPRSLAHERIDAGLAQHGLQAQAQQAVRALSGGEPAQSGADSSHVAPAPVSIDGRSHRRARPRLAPRFNALCRGLGRQR